MPRGVITGEWLKKIILVFEHSTGEKKKPAYTDFNLFAKRRKRDLNPRTA